MFSLSHLIITFGYIGIFLAIFAESGFFLGFFLPGDSLLFTIGILASKGHFNIVTLVIVGVLGAVLGDSFGYWMGKRFGHPLFEKAHSQFLKKEYLERTEQFFEKYGKKTVILSRFVPIVRTFAPIFAGIGLMPYRTFLSYNVVGGTVWAGGLMLISYYVGRKIPGINQYLGYVILIIVAVSLIPPLFEIIRQKRRSR